MPERASVVVVGAGISGLTAAHQLARTGASIVVVDAADRAGGMVHTEHWRGFTIEHGPEGFLSTRPEALELIDDLGLAGDLVTGGPAPRRSFVLRRGRLQPLPQGVLQPTRTAARNLIASPLLSMRGRARLALEPVVGRNRSASDESVASFVRRRFGAELLDELVEPLVGGVHGAGTDELSAQLQAPTRWVQLACLDKRGFPAIGETKRAGCVLHAGCSNAPDLRGDVAAKSQCAQTHRIGEAEHLARLNPFHARSERAFKLEQRRAHPDIAVSIKRSQTRAHRGGNPLSALREAIFEAFGQEVGGVGHGCAR